MPKSDILCWNSAEAAAKKKASPSAKSTPQTSRPGTPAKAAASTSKKELPPKAVSQLQADMEGLGMASEQRVEEEPPPVVSMAKEKIIEQIKNDESSEKSKPVLSLVVVGEP
jgi:hypothetical protein